MIADLDTLLTAGACAQSSNTISSVFGIASASGPAKRVDVTTSCRPKVSSGPCLDRAERQQATGMS